MAIRPAPEPTTEHRVTYILDTNAILYNPDVVHDLADAEIVIPQVVLQELDKIKLTSNDRDLRFRARRASRFLFDLAEQGSLTDGVVLPNGSVVRIAVFDPHKNYPDNLSIKNSDDKIVAIAYQVVNERDGECILVTNDLNMLLKAQLLGIKIMRFVEEPATFLEKLGSRLRLRRRFKSAYPFLIVIMIGVFAIYMANQVNKAGSNQSDLPPELQQQTQLFKVKEDEYKRIIADNPKDFNALVGLGNLYYDYKQYQQAVDYYRKALKIKDDPNVRTDMATAYMYLGLYDRAAIELQTVVKQYPNHAKAHYNLAQTYIKLGLLNDAAKELEAFLKLVPYGPDAQYAQNQLQQIKAQMGVQQ